MTDSPHSVLREDPDIGPLVSAHGELTLDPADDLFQRLVVSICRQQVSMASAAATRDRLFDAVEVTPAGVLAADDAVLKDAGLSRQKTRYVNEVAAAFEEHGYSLDYFAERSDDEVRAELTAITGVGEWTANMQLLFALGREDVFPVGDLGVRKGFSNVVGEGYSRSEMREYAQRWAPYRSYATLYLWRAEEDIAESVAEVTDGHDK
ncbi:DNA-3-methyladenine glycosylase family protein [Haloarcula sediminis]|uniref:DNA-3-methyladenine glycosylase family protein n=1 Tax=Haloarcula sediminis TaxID=3111777 RepID=UPI002D764B3F|nr:DNA-3-methyladenine glycosylase 2 family protein [Haloarcula sp. CK38]